MILLMRVFSISHLKSDFWLWSNLQKTSPVAKDLPSPKFDLEASSFPPLPGCADCAQGEATQEMRLSDIVRGLKVANKVAAVSTWEANKNIYSLKTTVIILGEWGDKHKDLRRCCQTRSCYTASPSRSSSNISLEVGLDRANDIIIKTFAWS